MDFSDHSPKKTPADCLDNNSKVQLISNKRFLECTVYTHSMETIYLSLVHTASWGNIFHEIPVE